MRILISLLLSFVLVSNGSLAAKRPMTTDDALNVIDVGGALMSPDGRHVFYSKTELVWEKNDYKTTYYMTSVKTGETIQYLGEAGGESFQFSPDGQYLTLMREVDEAPQIFIMPTSGGEAVQLTHHRGAISGYKWTADTSKIFFNADEPRTEEEEKEHRLGADPVFVDEAPNGKEEARFNNLWSFDLKTNKETRLSNEEMIVMNFDVSPDGSRLVFTGAPDTRTNYGHMSELYLLDVNSKKLKRLTHNEALESGPVWAPDGKTFAYRASSDKKFELHEGYFWIMNPDTGKTRKLLGQNQGGASMPDQVTAWTADGRYLFFNEQDKTAANLFKLNIKTDKVTAVTKFPGVLTNIRFSKDRKYMVYGYEDITTPRDLYVSKIGRSPVDNLSQAERITDANPWVREELTLSPGEDLRWTSRDGMEIEGWFIPALKHSGDKMPLIVNVHGGPAGITENTFRTDFQILAGLGYAILGPNARGSIGYSDEVLRGLIGEVGDGEFVDQMNGVDYVIAHKNIDPQRLGIRGESWGGVSTSYTITQTQRYKAASIGSMVGNWAAEHGPGFDFDVALWYIGGTPWDDPAEWAKRSSITHVKNVTTPTFIYHGDKDTNSSPGQSLMFFTALRDIGKAPVHYIKLPRQEHSIYEPRMKRIVSIEEIRWFKKYIDGEDWRPWVRATTH